MLAILAVVAISLLGACAAAAPASVDDRPVALTTFTVLADLVENVAGEHIRVESITKVGAEIHGYEPTPGDIRRASEANLIFDNGLGLEAWFDEFVAQLDVPHVVVSDGIRPIAIEDGANTVNPHAWMSPVTVETYLDNIVAGLVGLAPEYRSDFEENAAGYRAGLAAIRDGLADRIAALPPEHRALVTCEGAFSYLARDAGLDEGHIWPVNAEQQATPQQIASTIEFVRERSVPAVFCESTVSDEPMQQVVRETGAAFGGVLYVDSLSGEDGPVPTYLSLLRHDVETIVEALSGSQSG